ncbi:Myo-inositol 2-dehydrogenase 1 [Rubellimicrobium mesophilum DSM 19309]|uniref:Inositol 2-dehydrogenase n=1 Tax=Rubellimicrobium mesophilum DSM 19309 TaxID=442562 RepID=A0A017HV65_9RHOB|nr:Gfo/Idh/MocA family oxidoreductase [Rubellimicrobium mesophilum]EYD78220.1 Myo-inositol 2-dehydrogenase 1 [Rubellimicrobium mesophilum DSM 19309]
MTLNIGVIGTGAIGRDHIRRITNTLSGARVTAVTDVQPKAAEETIATYGLDARALATGQEVIASRDVDAVLVTSWGPTHEEFVLASLAAGKPVFCEKPLATTAQGALNIVKAETALNHRLVQVGFMRRYDAGYRALKSVIDSGQIGAPLIVHCAHRNPDVPERYTTDMAINDTVIHELDVLRWLLDDDYVSAQVVYPRRSRHAFAHLADPQIVLLETAKGARIDVEVFVNCQYGYDIQCEVVGEAGTARLPEPMAVPLRVGAQRVSAILTDWKERFIASYDVELQDFIDAASEGTAAGPSSWDGLAAAVSADACVAAQGKPGAIVPITLPERPALYV